MAFVEQSFLEYCESLAAELNQLADSLDTCAKLDRKFLLALRMPRKKSASSASVSSTNRSKPTAACAANWSTDGPGPEQGLQTNSRTPP